ncbi:hypothetical protein ACFW1A_00800 [Kitasatospora sp. NPDC058965]|uniref:hypothetical protein n=1 Tax=Kitasatospora sp. NPDC058965 TaxID=3346682 RepID=UPI0036AC71AA
MTGTVEGPIPHKPENIGRAEFTVPPVPDGHRPDGSWRRTLTALDEQHGGVRGLLGEELRPGDLVSLPVGRLVIMVDKASVAGPKPVSLTVSRAGEQDAVFSRAFGSQAAAFGAATRRMLADLLAERPTGEGQALLVRRARASFTVPEVPAGLHPAGCWRKTVTGLDLTAARGKAVQGEWLNSGDIVALPVGALVVVVDKATTGWAENWRTRERYAKKDATVTVYRIGRDEPVWTRHFQQDASAFGETTRRKLLALLAAEEVPRDQVEVVREAKRPSHIAGACRWCGEHLPVGHGHLVGHGEDLKVEHYRECPTEPAATGEVCELCGVSVVVGQAERVLRRDGSGRRVVLHHVERFSFPRQRMCEIAPVPSAEEQEAADRARQAAEQAKREKEKADEQRRADRRQKRLEEKLAAEKAEQDRVAGLKTISRTTTAVFDKGLGQGRRATLEEHADLLEDGTTTTRWSVRIYFTGSGFNGEDYDPDEGTSEPYTTKRAAQACYQTLHWEPGPRRERPSGPRCDNCGQYGARHERHDSSGIAGRVCDSCNRDDDVMLSFA